VPAIEDDAAGVEESPLEGEPAGLDPGEDGGQELLGRSQQVLALAGPVGG
jgi:hypothetical protein